MKLFSLALLSAAALLVAGCDKSTDPEEDYMRPTITQPAAGTVIRDSSYTIKIDAEQNCGCASYVEFYIDDELLGVDYLREFAWSFNTAEWQGERIIIVHAVVPGSSSPYGIKAQGWDSVKVSIDLTN